MKVRVYFSSHATHEFPARDIRNAREIAKRIITEGCWIVNDDNSEEFYPVTQVYKVKIIPPIDELKAVKPYPHDSS